MPVEEPDWCRYTAAELQAQYSARSAVPEHPAIFRRWERQSRDYRDGAVAAGLARPNLAYGGHPRERLDLFLSDAGSGGGLHVFFHGGYWQALDRHHFSFVAEAPNRAGLAVAVVGYPLCPEVSLARIVEAAGAAIAWLRREAAGFGLRGEDLHLAGHSAGGHLVTALAAGDGTGGIAAVAPVSGVFELEPLVPTAINHALGLSRAEARRLGTLSAEPAPGIALDAFVGGEESDEFRRQSRQLVQRWRQLGRRAAHHLLPGHNHFTVLDAVYEPDGPMVHAARQRLAG